MAVEEVEDDFKVISRIGINNLANIRLVLDEIRERIALHYRSFNLRPGECGQSR